MGLDVHPRLREHVYIAKDPENFHQVAGGGFGVDVLYLNNETKPFNDVAFRKALNMVVDRADISATAGYGVWPRDHERHRPAAALRRRLHLGRVRRPGADRRRRRRQGRSSTDAGYTWDGDVLIDPDGETVTFTLQNPTGWTDYLDALGIIAEGAADARCRGDRGAASSRTPGSTTSSRSATSRPRCTGPTAAARPWNMYSNIMDGASYVPLGESATWNFGRYQNDEVTEALADFKAGTSEEDRAAALDVVQERFVEDVPGLVDLVPSGGRAVLDGRTTRASRPTRTPTRTRSPRVRRRR